MTPNPPAPLIPELREYLTAKQVADELGCHARTITRAAKKTGRDGLPYYDTPWGMRFARDDVSAWVKGMRRVGRA